MSKLTLSFKGKVLRVYPLEGGETLIGRAPDCDIVIDSLAVSPYHARIVTNGQSSILRDEKDSEGVFINAEKIAEHPLEHGDVIRIGKHTLTYTEATADADEAADNPEPSPVTSTAPIQAGWIQMLSGAHVGRTIRLDKSMVRFGKPGAPSALISRRGDGYFISHLEGDQTTKVSGSFIGDRSYRLQDGDMIDVGDLKLLFFLDKE